MQFENLRGLYVQQLMDLYDAERQLAGRLPGLAKRARSSELRGMLEKGVTGAKRQMRTLESLFTSLEERPAGETECEGMAGLLRETENLADIAEQPAVRDAALIAGIQRIKHYEIAGYGCARAYAERLGEQQASSSLKELLDDEASLNEKLSELAMKSINEQALEPVAVQ